MQGEVSAGEGAGERERGRTKCGHVDLAAHLLTFVVGPALVDMVEGR